MFKIDAFSQKQLAALNNSSPTEGCGTVLNQTKNLMKAFASFALYTGAVASYNISDDQSNPAILPLNAYVTNVVAIVATTLASGASGALALTSQLNAADLMVAKTVMAAGTIYAGVPVGTAATWVGPITAKAGSQLQAVISVGALTAYSVEWFVEFVIA